MLDMRSDLHSSVQDRRIIDAYVGRQVNTLCYNHLCSQHVTLLASCIQPYLFALENAQQKVDRWE